MHISLNHGAVLVGAVVVGGDAAGAEVHALTHRGVTQVSQVVGLGATAQGSVFHFDKVTDMDLVRQVGARPEPCKRTNACIASNLHCLLFTIDMAKGLNKSACTNMGIGNHAVGAYAHTIA